MHSVHANDQNVNTEGSVNLAQALHYASLGLPVFPVHTPMPDGSCSCRQDCGRDKGKHPRTLNGCLDATTNAIEIERWWGMWPEANIGIATGAQAGVIVLDIDGNEGKQSLDGNGLPPTPMQTTGKGEHWFFLHPGGTVKNHVKLRAGLDLRGDGGYVVAAPSLHASGKRYQWVISPDDISPVSVPNWLRELIDNKGKNENGAAGPVDDMLTEGARNDTLASIAGTNRRRGMNADEIYALLSAVNAQRCAPPLDDAEVRKIANSIARYEPEDSAFTTNGRAPEERAKTVPIPPAVIDCPPLPKYARLQPEQLEAAATAGNWVDDYVEFAAEASPLTPLPFHLAGALFVGGLIIARRICLRVSVEDNTIYPNLYMLFVGPSTRPRKTTGLRVVKGLLREAGLRHYLLADRQTPEALALDLTTRVPPLFGSMTPEDRARWEKERPIAAKRGWLLEEASHLFDSFTRDYSKGLLPMVLDLYDSSDMGPSANTMSRGRESIEDTYINIFGATTFAAMSSHAQVEQHWHNGLFARFALVGHDKSGAWQFWPPPMDYPDSLVSKIKYIANGLLPELPAARLRETESGKGVEVVLDGAVSAQSVEIDSIAWAQWAAYSEAVSFDMLDGSYNIPQRFYANYGRLGTMLVKVAMILATLDASRTPIRVEPRHIYRAQTIVESWREGLHQILDQTEVVTENTDLEYVYAQIAKAGQDWVTRRDLLLALGTGKWTWARLEPIIRELRESGRIESRPAENQRGPKSEMYRVVVEI